MFTDLLSKFGSFSQTASFFFCLELLATHFLENYKDDSNAKNAVIDSLVEYLQTLKSK